MLWVALIAVDWLGWTNAVEQGAGLMPNKGRLFTQMPAMIVL